MDLGFDGASMGEIARAAGVSKGTLYVYFADKNRLFEAIVEEEMLEQGKLSPSISNPSATSPPRCGSSARPISQLLCRPGGGSAIRTVMAIAERMPDVGRRYYEHVLEKTINRLAAYLERACGGEDCDRRLPSCGIAIHADVPGVAVSAVHFSGRPAAVGRAHRAGSRKRDADVSRGVSGEAGLIEEGALAITIQVSNSHMRSPQTSSREARPCARLEGCGPGTIKTRITPELLQENPSPN